MGAERHLQAGCSGVIALDGQGVIRHRHALPLPTDVGRAVWPRIQLWVLVLACRKPSSDKPTIAVLHVIAGKHVLVTLVVAVMQHNAQPVCQYSCWHH